MQQSQLPPQQPAGGYFQQALLPQPNINYGNQGFNQYEQQYYQQPPAEQQQQYYGYQPQAQQQVPGLPPAGPYTTDDQQQVGSLQPQAMQPQPPDAPAAQGEQPQAALPAPPAPPTKPGLFAKLTSLFSRGKPEAGQDGVLEAGQDNPNQQGDSRDPNDAVTLSYALAFKVHEPNPQLEQQLMLQFDRNALGHPRPTPQRSAVLKMHRMPKEELGLYVEKRPSLGQHSLVKMEQRLTKGHTLDKAELHALVGDSQSVEEAAQAEAHKHALKQGNSHGQHQLVVGALPSLIEEEEDAADRPVSDQQPQPAPAHSQAGLLAAPAHPPGASADPALFAIHPPQPAMPPLMTDPQQVWHALQYHQQGLTQVGALDPNHPNHLQLLLVQQALQQMSAGGPLPAVGLDGLPVPPTLTPATKPCPFLDDDGLLIYTPDPLKLEKERPSRRYDQDKEATRTYVRPPILDQGASSEAARTYRLDIELGRFEFLVHPAMVQEDLLAAKLLAAFKEFKRREAIGLASFYANRLAALEESLLSAREVLFDLAEQAVVVGEAGAAAAAALAAAQGGAEGAALAGEAAARAQGQEMSEELRAALDNACNLEKEVAITRQLKEEEELFMIRAVESMQWIYSLIQTERSTQGYWRTSLELTVQQRPPEEQQWAMGTGVPRDRLDALVLVAEEEAISGLPPPPMPFPPPAFLEDLPAEGFRPRRIESMCGSHRALLTQLTNRLNDLKGRPSADPSDPVMLQLQDQIKALSVAPRRLAPITPEERAYVTDAAIHRVLAGDIGVPRYPKLLPILTSAPGQTSLAPPDQAAGGQHMDANGVPANVGRGRPAGPRGSGPKNKYYVRVYVNGHYVDTSQPALVNEEFVGKFKDVFSVQVVRWPESITLELYDKGPLRDTLLSTVYVGVPGLAGSPHVDPRHLGYQFTSQAPYRLKAPGQLSPPGSPGRPGSGPLDLPGTVYPAGVVYARCGWVAQWAPAGTRMDDMQAHMVAYDNPLSDIPNDVEAARSLMPPVPNITVDRMLRRAAERIGCKVNRQTILKWLSHNQVEPNDPRNAPLLELLRAQEATSGGMGDLFRLDVFPDIAIDGNRHQGKRISFLARRWASGPYRDPERSVLKGQRHVRIPAVLSARDTEDMEHLYLDALALVELVPGGSGPAIARAMISRQDRARTMQIGPELTKGIEEREARIKNYALRIRGAANRIAGGKQAGRKYVTDDVVNDLPLPEFKVDLTTLANIVAPRRPLKPRRKVMKSMQTSVPPDTELMITIQRATNLPLRRTGAAVTQPNAKARGRRDIDRGEDQQQPSSSPASSSHVQAFVEVRFRGMSRRTISCGSDFPTFNEMITLPVFGAEEEPSSQTLYENSDVVTINVFDEVINDRVGEPRVLQQNKEDAVSDPVRYPERERYFLGCIRVPLSAVYQMQVLEGTFKLEVPPVMLGYSQRSERPPSVTLYMSLKPRLAPPADVNEHLLSGEMEDITSHARVWLGELQQLSQCRSRVIRALAVDAEGTSLLVTRFVCPTRLPPSVMEAITKPASEKCPVSHTEEVMLKAARFVSQLPYLEDSALQKRRVDVWSTSADALHMAAGDAEEHAHLLAGFFLELGQQAFIVMGASTFGARSYFVLTTGKPEYGRAAPLTSSEVYKWNEHQLRLWNPLSGGVVSVKDATGELREVGAVYNHTNVWANIQLCGAPWELHWQLNDPRYWNPFFGVQLPIRELGTVQEPVAYDDNPALFYEQLETRVEEAARDALQKARALGAFVTKPDNKVSRVLKSLLREMPQAVHTISASSLAASLALADLPPSGALPPLGNGLNERHRAIVALQDAHNEKVCREVRADWVHGHILALPFSDKYTDAVCDAVLNTGLHRIADERVKYSVAALVERGGSAFNCCIWIYMAATR